MSALPIRESRPVHATFPLRHCLLGVLATLSIATTSAAAGTIEHNPVRTHPAAASEAVEQRILVKLRPSAASAAHAQALSVEAKLAKGASTITTVNGTMQALAARASLMFKQSREIANGLHLLQVQSATGESTTATLARLRADPQVESAEIDQRRYAHAVPNDPLFTGQWYEQATQAAGIDAVTAWDTTTGRGDVVIAELDTGVRYDHPDLLAASQNGRLLPGYDFITNPAVANDGDGRDADASDPGDWITSADAATAQFSGCTVENSSWHGTRVAGILGALSNNATGITGITWQPKILPVRVLGKCGGVDSDILDAMRWAAGLHVTGVPDNTHPARIINMSLGGTGACTTAEQTVINEVVAAGVTVVISAGNEGGPVDSPANCVGVAGIAGLRQIGTKVGFSSLGPEVALASPAGNCVNATGTCLFSIDTTINNGTTTPGTNGYTDQLNPNLGTSFSAPIVAGIAGLMYSVNSNLNPAQMIARLKEGSKTFPVSSDPTVPNCHVPASSTDLQTAECNCTASTCGAGMANAPGALKAALRPIAAIAVPAPVSPGQNVSLSGTGSAAACGHTISTYAWSTASGNAIQGANTATATVVAPATGSITLQLTVTDDAGRTDTANVTVSTASASTSAPANANSGKCPSSVTAVALAVTPANATVAAGGTQTFTATVTNTSNTAVTWSVNGVAGGNSTVGMVSAAGVYTAPASVPSPATVTVTATSVADATKSASAQVTISAPVAISITPSSASVQTGMTQTFAAAVTGSSNNAVSWRVNNVAGGNATVGMISSSGVYTAPMTVPSPATVTVAAVSAADSTKQASAQVTVLTAAAASSGGGSGTSTTAGNSTSSGNNGGGGPMDPLTLLVCTLVTGMVTCRRGGSARRL
jgi:serine protease